MLESYFEYLCISLDRPAGKIPPFVNYTLLCAGIISLNQNEYKIINVGLIRIYNDKNIGCVLLEFQLASVHSSRDVYNVDVILTPLNSTYFFWCRPVSTIALIETT